MALEVFKRDEISGASVVTVSWRTGDLAESWKRVLNAVSMASEGCVMLSGPGG